MIDFQNVTVQYGERYIVNNANFQLPSGDIAYLTGKSGAGKSTIMKLLTHEISAQQGKITIHNKELQQWKKHELRRQFGIVFQNFELIANKTVLENIYLSALVKGISVGSVQQLALELLERVGLAGKEKEFPSTLSGGEQQRVAIVRALICQPTILLADEPTGNLDEQTAFEVMSLLHHLQKEKQFSLLIITHDLQLIEQFPAKRYVLANGEVNQLT